MADNKSINEFLNKEEVVKIIEIFKTSNWEKLNEMERYNVYENFNKELCAFFNIKKIGLELSKDGLTENDLTSDSAFHNITISDHKLWINDIYYNQYLTLYEYVVKAREKVQDLVCYTVYGKNFNSKLKKQWLDNFKSIEYKNSFIDYKIEDEEYLFEYQPHKADSLSYAEKMVVEIVKYNYDKDNSYDEQYFMNNSEILVPNVVKKAGIYLYEELWLSQKKLENLINNLKKRIKNVEDSKCLKDIDNGDLFIFIYPDFSKGLKPHTLVKIYKEIVSRICPSEIEITYGYNKIIINNNQYKLDYFNKNHFNIVLYECLRAIENDLRDSKEFRFSSQVKEKGINEAINDYKYKFILKVIKIIDTSIDWSKLEGVNYQPLFRILNKEDLKNNLKSNINGKVPYKKWRR